MTLESNKIKENHQPGFKGIIKIYNWNEIKESKAFIISLIMSFILLILSFCGTKDISETLKFWVNQILTIFPNLLGFSLGGFALIVGFGNSELIQSLTKSTKGKQYSVFQKLSAVFAFLLIIQSITFLISFITNIILELNFKAYCISVYYSINIFMILLLSFLALWGMFILPVLVVNVFTFGQVNHFLLTVKRINAEQKNEQEYMLELLNKLNDLLNNGIISQEEVEILKARIIKKD